MLRRTLFLLSVIVFTAYPAYADSFVITNGSARVSTPIPFGSIPLFQVSLLHTEFAFGGSISSIGYNVPVVSCPFGMQLCIPGVQVSLASSVLADATDFLGPAVFNMHGTLYRITLTGINLFAGSVAIPFGGDPTVMLQTPFTLSSFMAGTDSFGNFASAQLTGGGIATLTMNRVGVDQFGNPMYRYDNITYTFQTPEPATLLLLATALGALIYKRR